MRRHHIVLGDRTTSAGVVITASSTSCINGKAIPVEGDRVTCPACKSVGYIIATGPRIEEREGGKLLALENDVCCCKCPAHPRLIPSQSFSFHAIEGGTWEEPSRGQAADTAESQENPQEEEILEQFFEVLDEHGSPVHGYKFDVHADDAVHEKAGHFAFGRTPVVQKDADAQIVMWPRGDGGADHG